MPKRIELREFSEEERQALERLSRSSKAAHKQVQRAKALLLKASGRSTAQVAEELRRGEGMVRWTVRRFNEGGLAGLEDAARSGRPLEYSQEQRGEIIAAARTHPQEIGVQVGHWTRDRLVEYVNQQLGISISRAQLGRVLEDEGLKWYQEKTYFTERPDPQYAEKRGR
jgi:transposase